jgi:outer membrane receptor for ferrienterochelin and colicins
VLPFNHFIFMKQYSVLLLAMLFAGIAQAQQHTLAAYVTDSRSNEPLPGATVIVKGSSAGGSAGLDGLVMIPNVTAGLQVIETRCLGYITRIDSITVPTDTLRLSLAAEAGDLEEVVISSTRSSRTIEDIPTRVEYIAGEELDEKANMKPGDIRVVLSESTGIQVQQTSATSANASIRIQGLDGRYTQLLKDGFPLYSGASAGLGLLQIPPLDLKQVELIKGSASTLYGGGAIAGLVNLISKTPQLKRELSFHVNGTSGGGADVNGFYGQRYGKTGMTVFAAHNRNTAYDPAGIDFSAIPKFERYTLNPRFFWYPGRTQVSLGINTTYEDRIGGDMHYIRGERDTAHGYFEKNRTQRMSTQFAADHSIGECDHLLFKNSLTYFDRRLSIPGYDFHGKQYASFTEASYARHGRRLEWVIGANAWTDQFDEDRKDTLTQRDYAQQTVGAFIQNTWNAASWLTLESGFRTDYVIDYGWALLPRLSALFRLSPVLTSRLGGGFGYKPPTIFTEESERIQYRGVLPVTSVSNTMENSYGGNWDVNYKTMLLNDNVSLSINHLFFYTYITNPLILTPQPGNTYRFENISGHIDTKGTETNIKLGYKDFKLFLGYTYTYAQIEQNGVHRENYLTPRHKVNSVLFYEVEERWKAGLEAYYFSPQQLSDGTTGRAYVMMGFMLERLWERFSVYVNFENFLDARQTRFGTIYTGTVNNPSFRDIYAPLDGFIVNGGIKIRL